MNGPTRMSTLRVRRSRCAARADRRPALTATGVRGRCRHTREMRTEAGAQGECANSPSLSLSLPPSLSLSLPPSLSLPVSLSLSFPFPKLFLSPLSLSTMCLCVFALCCCGRQFACGTAATIAATHLWTRAAAACPPAHTHTRTHTNTHTHMHTHTNTHKHTQTQEKSVY